MLKIERILCPVDFSECSAKAYDYTYSLAVRYRARLYVEHVIQIPAAAYPYYNFPDVAGNNMYWDLSRGAEDRLQEMVKHRAMNGLQAEMMVHKGFVPESIFSFAQNLQADMIVMGTHGRRGLDRLVMGSVTKSMLRKARCPAAEESVLAAMDSVFAAGISSRSQ
jgi:universal stress protein A